MNGLSIEARARKVRVVAMLVVAFVGLASCGGGGGSPLGISPPPGQSPPPPDPVPPTTPTGLRAVLGGNSVALMWNASTGASAVNAYNVIRNGARITTTSTSNPGTVYRKGTRHIDAGISPGGTYTYQVQAVDSNGVLSALSTSITVTAPLNTTPVPQITVDFTNAPDLTAWTNDVVLPELRAWYPKIADLIAFPDYTPPASFKIVYESTYPIAAADVVNSIIMVNPAYARSNPADLGMFIHEATHIMQKATGFTRGWIIEGIADWAREYPYHDRDPIVPAATDSYILGYSQGSVLVNYIQANHDPQFIRKLTVALRNDVYKESLFRTATGRTADQLWTDMTTVQIQTGAIVSDGFAGRCVDNRAFVRDDGNKITTYPCNRADNQFISAVRNADATLALRVHEKCLDVASSGTTNGTLVQLFTCNGTVAQKWVVNGAALVNPNSGKCLDAGNFDIETQLRIFDCNGAAAQKWRIGIDTTP